MFALQLHTPSTTATAKAEALWCAQRTMGLGLRQDSSYLVKPTSIRFANPEVGT